MINLAQLRAQLEHSFAPLACECSVDGDHSLTVKLYHPVSGQVDLVIEAGLQAYDVQAPIAVIEAAGGIVTDWQGRPCLNGGQVLAAANREIHAEALALLNG